ncbi:hypothetical protein [Erythrobacter dokdonensis]|uniref:Uncharacterized protein n=1 Tax=Erythrobacter dokdonensis DSW-74 TaxID=1300349 RepID=A0A1A7BID0_9SPHN|nr:hypothetical protein [Erythrobacter dokdonensis]OBV12308.1 hypothetical protein I603_0439 [Erythrobacter dokdonensis DSW-74]
MALVKHSLALAGALAVTTALSAPARAADLPAAPPGAISLAGAFDHSRFDPAADTADWRCRGWRCNRWGGRWGRGWGRGWRRNRIDAGDVLIGAAIIGGIAAIASSNNRRVRTNDVVVVRDNDWRDDNRRFDDRRTERRSTGASGLDNAVDQCLTRIERDVRVDTVDNVERTGRGWLVSGALFNGSPFQCRIGNDGRIDDINFGGGGDWGAAPATTYTDRAEGQWSDTRYADARIAMGGMAQPQAAAPESFAARAPAQAGLADRPMPAYPGGPIPGEVIPETIDGDIGG